MGALVYSQESCGDKVEINIANLQSGIYFVRHISSDGGVDTACGEKISISNSQ